MCALCGNYVNSGSLYTRAHGIGSRLAAYSASFLISGLSAAVILWHPMHRSTDGRPAYSLRRASAWQYWHSILYVCTWTMCGNAIGWTEGLATAGCRLQEDTPRNISTARRTTAAAPTPAFRIDSRLSSWRLGSAREPYHLPAASVNDNSRYVRLASASAAARPALSRSASECASDTKAASNCEGARYTPRSSIAPKKRA